jgi:hypothetical protein
MKFITEAEYEQLQPYLDEQNRVTTWPSKRNRKSVQFIVLKYLAAQFEPGATYHEREVNDLLRLHHTFDDPALLRRELFESGLINRTRNGFSYWRNLA